MLRAPQSAWRAIDRDYPIDSPDVVNGNGSFVLTEVSVLARGSDGHGSFDVRDLPAAWNCLEIATRLGSNHLRDAPPTRIRCIAKPPCFLASARKKRLSLRAVRDDTPFSNVSPRPRSLERRIREKANNGLNVDGKRLFPLLRNGDSRCSFLQEPRARATCTKPRSAQGTKCHSKRESIWLLQRDPGSVQHPRT